MRRIIAISAIGLFVVACTATPETQTEAEAQSHPIIGTWELNLERSTFDPGPGPQSAIHRYEEGDDGFILYTRISVGSSGNPAFVQTAFKLDGEAHPVYTNGSLAQLLTTGAEPNTGTSRSTDAYTIERVTGPITRNWAVSRDGQTLTASQTGTNGQGEAVNNVLVFDRVN